MRTKYIVGIVFCLFLTCCQRRNTSKEVKIVKTIPASFKMYKTSEMAALMRLMLQKNNELRKQIINGEDIGDFNQEFLKIHSATMTDPSQKDETYPTFANHFEEMQKAVFLVDSTQRKEQFNNAIRACVACHQDRCSGPIPRIKKLLIK